MIKGLLTPYSLEVCLACVLDRLKGFPNNMHDRNLNPNQRGILSARLKATEAELRTALLESDQKRYVELFGKVAAHG